MKRENSSQKWQPKSAHKKVWIKVYHHLHVQLPNQTNKIAEVSANTTMTACLYMDSGHVKVFLRSVTLPG